MANFDISLIICTRNRSRQLVRCLEAVACIVFERPWELIVVNNGSVDDTDAVVQQFVDSVPIPVHCVFEPKPGLGNARNAGVAAAGGKILAFTDDDCYPATDFLTGLWSAFEDRSVGYVTGRVVLHDPADAPIAVNESTTPRTLPGRYFVKPGDVSGANMAFRRSVLDQIGGFDPLFGAGALFPAEDLDAAGRASAIGWKGQYHPEVVVRHHHGRKPSDRPRLYKAYGLGQGGYHMKLLLEGREFLWFAKSVYRIPRRYKGDRGMLLWELVGTAKYAFVYLTRIRRRRAHAVRSRPDDRQAWN